MKAYHKFGIKYLSGVLIFWFLILLVGCGGGGATSSDGTIGSSSDSESSSDGDFTGEGPADNDSSGGESPIAKEVWILSQAITDDDGDGKKDLQEDHIFDNGLLMQSSLKYYSDTTSYEEKTTYQYDSEGKPISSIYTFANSDGISSRTTTTFSYDSIGRPISDQRYIGYDSDVVYDDRIWTTTYTYSNNGKLEKQEVEDCSPYSGQCQKIKYTYYYDTIGRLESSIITAEDSNGSITTINTTTYTYDADGRCILAVTETTTNINATIYESTRYISYTYGPDGKLALELTEHDTDSDGSIDLVITESFASIPFILYTLPHRYLLASRFGNLHPMSPTLNNFANLSVTLNNLQTDMDNDGTIDYEITYALDANGFPTRAMSSSDGISYFRYIQLK